MKRPTFLERLLHKIELKTNFLLASVRRKRLNNTDFTIISNNCFGGIVYEYFGLQKLSPTVGCYFFADDYLKFISRLDYYLNQELNFIPLHKSKYSKKISELSEINKENLNAPIGLLDDVTIVFLHYRNQLEAYEKWNRRIQRINYDNLIFKFSHQNLCSNIQIEKFDKLNLNGKKICFIKTVNTNIKCGVYYPGFEQEDSIDDIYNWHKYFNLEKFINTGNIVIRPTL